jgi:hypothetical protein
MQRDHVVVNDKEIALHFKLMKLIFYELQCLASSNSVIYL